MPTENRSRNTDPHHDDDKKVIVEQHRQYLKLTDDNWMDEASAFQDQAYALGRARGKIEGAQPAPQPHPDPIAWMVGTAFWWTKEEAERDAAATGLQIVGLGPMACSADAEQLREVIKHSDAQIMRQSMRISNQRAQLAEAHALRPKLLDLLTHLLDNPHTFRDHILNSEEICELINALSASAEPSAPVEIDERAEFERRFPDLNHTLCSHEDWQDQYECSKVGYMWNGWKARAALERNPQVKP